ncbi:MAG: bifunctional 4-hydroxy-2-oxoglutarate aldolase/2-dehydro-3-deoxy-phosphogluconate aldolase [Pseudobutyrivibrio ruminis]|jgi:2-dehydro-3-deoxyphosphogluconate aldolase/(4S)-4-hydroxy-2-oxoglutarate aldolase|nr:bifunctional 4-hydroxy-2-oxoglutarate aldolase/2-dehydro-3-deoxy-phosphogluconate aldolase [Pseudobutyrivibrio ruminis]
MKSILEKLQKIGIVPVIKIEDKKDAVPLAKALYEGGLPCAEVTFRTPACVESIHMIKEAYPSMIVGAGTVLTREQVDQAMKAGAQFIVSPGLNPLIVKYCEEKQIPIIPGCANPSDIEQALQYGLELVKFFPAEAAGGLNMIKSMSAPYGNMKFMPTGGINKKNLRSYLDFEKIIACGGTWMVSGDLIENGEFEKIKDLTKDAVETMLGFELAHVGLNMESAEDANQTVKTFEGLFGFSKSENPNSIFAGRYIEAMKAPYLGKNGHIGIFTIDIERAVYHLERQGVVFNKESAKFSPESKLTAIYLEQEIGGFAVHLVQKSK